MDINLLGWWRTADPAARQECDQRSREDPFWWMMWNGVVANITSSSSAKTWTKAYLDMVKALSVYPEVCSAQHDLKIVYTPIHGTGIMLVPQALAKYGFTNVHIVKNKAIPTATSLRWSIPTRRNRNHEHQPENARELNADILLGTDPMPTVGIGVKNHKGEWILMNGNQTALLAFNYMIEARKTKGLQQPNDMVVKTIVTTDMIDVIARQAASIAIMYLPVSNGSANWSAKKKGRRIHHRRRRKFRPDDRRRDPRQGFGKRCLSALRDGGLWKNKAAACSTNSSTCTCNTAYKESLVSITRKGMNGAKEIADMMEGYRKIRRWRSMAVKWLNCSTMNCRWARTSKPGNLEDRTAEEQCTAVRTGRRYQDIGRPSGTGTQDQILHFSVNTNLPAPLNSTRKKRTDERSTDH